MKRNGFNPHEAEKGGQKGRMKENAGRRVDRYKGERQVQEIEMDGEERR